MQNYIIDLMIKNKLHCPNKKKKKRHNKKPKDMIGMEDNLLSFTSMALIGKFRLRLIELISFKLKLLIRYIMNETC